MTLSANGADHLMTLFIAAGMSLFMSAAMLLVKVGVTPEFLLTWMKDWVVSTAVAYPAALMIVPMARKITCRLTRWHRPVG